MLETKDYWRINQMQFTIISMLWTISVFLFAFLFTLMIMQDDIVYSPMYSFLVLTTGFALGFCWARERKTKY